MMRAPSRSRFISALFTRRFCISWDSTRKRRAIYTKAAKNDCAGAAHSCQGQAKKDGDAKEWINVPKGTCERLVNGSLTAK